MVLFSMDENTPILLLSVSIFRLLSDIIFYIFCNELSYLNRCLKKLTFASNNQAMKNLKIVIALFTASFFLFAFSSVNNKEESRIPWKDGLLDGSFMIHIQGTSSGANSYTFQGHYRNGMWRLYGRNNKLIAERLYQNDFEYEDVINHTKVLLNRDENGLYEFPKIEEKDVAVSQRVWKMISPEQIKKNKALAAAIKQIDLAEFKAYRSDELRDTINIHKSKQHIKSLKIMGDWFYDKHRQIATFYILAICPIYGDQSKEAWYYYPDIRKKMASIKVKDKYAMAHNLDELFFLGSYPYIIYKIERLEDKAFEKDNYEKATIETIKYQLTTEALYWK